MANVFTNWGEKSLAPDVIMSFNETGKIDDSWYIRTSMPVYTQAYAQLAAVTVLDELDTTDITESSTTETAALLTPDTKPIRGQVTITQAAVDTNDMNLFTPYGKELGAKMRQHYEYKLCNYLLTTAVATGSTVDFNDDTGFTGQEVLNGLVSTNSIFNVANVPSQDRYCLLHDTYFSQLYSISAIRSSDFVSSGDNTKPFTEINIMGLRTRSASMRFNVDDSANTNYGDAKYKINNAASSRPNWGVAWHKQALAVNIFSEPNVQIEKIPAKPLYKVSARMFMGTTTPRPTLAVRLHGDA